MNRNELIEVIYWSADLLLEYIWGGGSIGDPQVTQAVDTLNAKIRDYNDLFDIPEITERGDNRWEFEREVELIWHRAREIIHMYRMRFIRFG